MMFGFKFGKKSFPYMERDSTIYAALRDGMSSPSEEGGYDEKNLFQRQPAKASDRCWKLSVVLLLVITNILTFVAVLSAKHFENHIEATEPEYVPESWARVDTLPTTYNRLNWWTEYSEKNFTETDALWDEINPAHGFIAMDREWALSQHWPESMHLPSDDSKNVYLLEAYHLLHCVTIIHKTFWQAVNHEEPYRYHPPHAGHCIDMMRQYIMCKADNTPLYLFGDDTAGDEQYRKCNSWDALRQYATDHSACYRDTPDDVDPTKFALGEHFGYCDGGHDGLKPGERRGPWKHGAVFDGPSQ